MNWKTISIIIVILIVLAVCAGVIWKMVQKTEGYKTMGNSYYYTFEPHQTLFGCARYNAPPPQPEVKK